MRYEYAKNQPFNIQRRLDTWLKNEKKFQKEKTPAKKEKEDASKILQRKYGLID